MCVWRGVRYEKERREEKETREENPLMGGSGW